VNLMRAGYSWMDPLRLVSSPDGRFVLQSSTPLTPGETIYIEVLGKAGTSSSGDYEMTVDFNSPAVDSRKLAEGQMASWNTTHAMRMVVPESTFFHFSLEAWRNTDAGAAAQFGTASRVKAEILNSSNQVVTTITAEEGLNSLQVFLQLGNYTVRFLGQNSLGMASGGAWYEFRGARLSDPIDVFDFADTTPSMTPPVTFEYVDPSDDADDMWFIGGAWSEAIG
jgi:hypothetical protein